MESMKLVGPFGSYMEAVVAVSCGDKIVLITKDKEKQQILFKSDN